MLRAGTPCSSTTSGLTSAEKENLRRQIVGLAYKRDTETSQRDSLASPTPNVKKKPLASIHQSLNIDNDVHGILHAESSPYKRKNNKLFPPGSKDVNGNNMPTVDPDDALRNAIRRSKTTLHLDNNKSSPKIVRFRMDEVVIGKHRAPIVHITDAGEPSNNRTKECRTNNKGDVYEVRGNAISVKKEGLRGLIEYKELCSENEKKQTSLQTTLKLFRRRMKLNQEKFIQPNETTTEDYVIHTKSPFRDVISPSFTEEAPIMRPGSSTNEHVRLLRSALHNKHNGVVNVKQTDNLTSQEDDAKNIKCSYRLPDNLNWGKEVSFKDIKDDSIPNVKTYVLKEDSAHHNKFRKNNLENTVTLNMHNLNVHNSITHINGMKIKLADGEVEFDPRLFDWLEDIRANMKLFKSTSFSVDEPAVECVTPSAKRRPSLKT